MWVLLLVCTANQVKEKMHHRVALSQGFLWMPAFLPTNAGTPLNTLIQNKKKVDTNGARTRTAPCNVSLIATRPHELDIVCVLLLVCVPTQVKEEMHHRVALSQGFLGDCFFAHQCRY